MEQLWTGVAQLIDEFAQVRTRPSSHECLTTQPHHRVEASFRSERREPGVEAATFAGHAHQPASKSRHRAEQQEHFDACTFAREAVLGNRGQSALNLKSRL